MKQLHQLLSDLGLIPPAMPGLEDVLMDVAEGNLEVADAAWKIRSLAQGEFRHRLSRMVPILFTAMGTVFTMVGVGFAAYSVWSTAGTRETIGVVDEIWDGKARATYKVAGERHTVTTLVSSQPPDYAVGDQVQVLYRLEDPSQARINSFVELWLFPLAFGVGGLGFIILGWRIRAATRRSASNLQAN